MWIGICYCSCIGHQIDNSHALNTYVVLWCKVVTMQYIQPCLPKWGEIFFQGEFIISCVCISTIYFVNFALHEYFKTLNYHKHWISPFTWIYHTGGFIKWNSNCPRHFPKRFHPTLYMLSTLMYLCSLCTNTYYIGIQIHFKFSTCTYYYYCSTYSIGLMHYVVWKVFLQKTTKNWKQRVQFSHLES